MEEMSSMIRNIVLPALLALSAIALNGCAGSINVNTDYYPEAKFAAYRTFSFMPERSLRVAVAAPVSPLLEGRLISAATATLTSNGYRRVDDPDQADFVVSFTLGARDKIRVNSYPSSYRGRWAWGGPQLHEVDVRNYTEGTLAIDIFDVATHQPVWFGSASKTISNADRANPTPLINEVVGAILNRFPPT
jgi:hypothetical protein